MDKALEALAFHLDVLRDCLREAIRDCYAVAHQKAEAGLLAGTYCNLGVELERLRIAIDTKTPDDVRRLMEAHEADLAATMGR